MLESTEHGRDEDSVRALQRRLEAIQREVCDFHWTFIVKCEKNLNLNFI